MVAVSWERTDPQRKCSYGDCEFKEKNVGKLKVTKRRVTKFLRASMGAMCKAAVECQICEGKLGNTDS